MKLGQPTRSKSTAVVVIVVGLLVLFSLLAFRNDILWIIGFPVEPDPNGTDTVLPLFYNCFVGFFLVYFFWMVLLAFQAILPVTNIVEDFSLSLLEVYRTVWHFFLYMIHAHGPVIFVQDGHENTTSEDLQRGSFPGVVVVDYNSAIVLEERNPPPGLIRVFINIVMGILRMLMLCDPFQSPRVRGAGITFTRPRERIRGVIDLRKQFRMVTRVPCYTREGIELQSNIFSVFTVGQDPDILEVTFDGPRRPENLRVVAFEHSHVDRTVLRVTRLQDDLDDADRAEIFHFARVRHHVDPVQPYTDLPDTTRQNYSPARVFAAVLGQARDAQHGTLPWTDLPARVGADLYREILSQNNYDELYNVQGNGPLPLFRFRGMLRTRMRNNGILAFRLVQTCCGDALEAGREYRQQDILVSSARQLTNPKVLRDRGIKILFCSFGDPIPVNEAVYQQRLDSWRAEWDRELEITQALSELDAMRVRSRAYADAQRDIWVSLSRLFDENQFSEEALALRLLQALEKAADDPKTRALLPANTIGLIRDLRMLLVPGDYMLRVP